MKVIVRPSINKDIKSLPKLIKQEVEQITLQILDVDSVIQIKNVKKLKGSSKAYRIRIGDYRLGFFLENDTVILSRILNRKEIYRYFP